MAKAPIEISTGLPLSQITDEFRRSMRVSWFSENITGAGTQFEKPRGSVFDEIDSDPPDFSVMAVLGGRGADIQRSAVYLYVWDRGDQREMKILVGKNIGALGIKAKTKIRKFAAALQAQDSTVRTTGL